MSKDQKGFGLSARMISLFLQGTACWKEEGVPLMGHAAIIQIGEPILEATGPLLECDRENPGFFIFQNA
ncbi:hypothetical protein P4282_05530 [Bacillus swezeyi]|uniref:hypothetical protein n=1 Tax=Bacillus swezeyi TaxID=1925020 RepID=UPI002E1CFD34|nr:hypothetical protein [Bacillus swezeyi]